MPGVLKPALVIEILLVMLLAGVGTAFGFEPNSAGLTATPGSSATPIPGGSLIITFRDEVYNSANTQLIGVMVGVRNKDTVAHSGIINVAVEQEGETITGSGIVTDLAAGATVQIMVGFEPIAIDTYLEQLSVVVTQTQ